MKPRSLVAMAHVEGVARSIDFSAKLGFSVRNTFEHEGEDEPTWAPLHADRAELVVTGGERSSGADDRARNDLTASMAFVHTAAHLQPG